MAVGSSSGRPRCFVAYPSSPADRVESIETAIATIQSGGVVDVIGWTSISVSGRLLIDVISQEIEGREMFLADVTGLNPNVMFELGYAIARRRRIWLLLNPGVSRARADWDRFQLLTTVGFASYNNSDEIVTKFYKQEPYKDLRQDLYDELLKAAGPPSKKDALLYLRSDVNTEASMRLARRVSAGPIRSVIDDPQENPVQSLAWYVQQVDSAFAVVCHLLSTNHTGWELHNAKRALVAGMAHGKGTPMLMLAHEPYESPLDYRDLLRKHRTAVEAEAIFDDWLLPRVKQYEERMLQAAAYRAERRAHIGLRGITVGEPFAEFESDSIGDYFVPTATYTETLRSKYSIVVGRKGTGKTAMLYKLAEDLGSDPRNHVCIIMPVAYELEGLMSILRQELSRAEQGYLVESFWKYLLYTELSKSVYEQLVRKPPYYTRSGAEAALWEFVEQNRSLILPEFSARLEAAVSGLHGISELASSDTRRVRISELLHSEMLSRLRVILGEVLVTRGKVTIAVDNLDKAWSPGGELALLSDLLFGLLGVSRRVAEEFARNASGRASVNLSFALFLRSDIYAAMLHFAKERDKLPARLMLWNDPELLKRVIEERFMSSDEDVDSPQQVWERYFTPTVKGIPAWEYVHQRILPRPRDLIYLIKAALQFAVDRGRTRLEERDLIDAERLYSRFALSSLVVEAVVRVPKVEDLLGQFVQSPEVITEEEIALRLEKVSIPRVELEEVISLFAELTFLGFEVGPNSFEFLYDEQDEQKMVIMARKTADETTNGTRRFRIHPAFHAFLEAKPHDAAIPGQMTIGL